MKSDNAGYYGNSQSPETFNNTFKKYGLPLHRQDSNESAWG